MADCSKANGTFCTTKTKEVCDFWCKVGVPEEICKKLLGSHWEAKICVVGKKVFCATSCCECPEMNHCAMFIEGVENEVPELPGLGGKGKMCFKKTGENSYHTKMTHETFGCIEWTEEFCDDGIKFEYTCKEKGASVCEKWCRKVCEGGSYRFKSCEGDINAIMAPLFGPDMKIDECFKECIKKIGDTFKTTICLGNTKHTITSKVDEEVDFNGVTCLTTRVGNGKYKMIQKKGNHVLETTTCFGDCGYTSTVVCQKTGKTAKLCMERYCEMSGCFKPISFCGTKEVCAAMGAPPGLAEKIMADCKAMICCKADGPFFCVSYKSSIKPMEFSFKLGEEFTFVNPFDPTDEQKCINAVCGNCMIGSSKGKCDTTSKLTFTENFLIQEYHITGTTLTEKIIYTRVDCGGCCNCC